MRGVTSRRLPLILVAVLGAMATISAHDMWIEPTSFAAADGKVIGVRLRVGQDLLGDPLPRDPALIDRFVVVDANGQRPIVGRDGGDPAGLLRPTAAGLSIVAYASRPSAIVMHADKFNQYLSEEGLEPIAALRARRNASNQDARELFARCAKALVLTGSPAPDQHDEALGLTLELIAERNPYAMKPNESLPVRLQYKGAPLAGALVVAMSRENPAVRTAVRTDASGRARLPLPNAGMWLVKAVHMVPAPADSGADWASFWASLTFELRASNGATGR